MSTVRTISLTLRGAARRAGVVALSAVLGLMPAAAPAQLRCQKLRWVEGAGVPEVELDCGSRRGVRAGMTGVLEAAGGGVVATIQIDREPDPDRSWASVTRGVLHVDRFAPMTALFDQHVDTTKPTLRVLAVDLSVRTAVLGGGCRQGVRKGMDVLLVRRLSEGGRHEHTTVGTGSVIDTSLETSIAAWTAAGPGHAPVAGDTEALVFDLAEAPPGPDPILVSGDGSSGTNIRLPGRRLAVGTRLALVRPGRTKAVDVQYAEAIVEIAEGDDVVARILDPVVAQRSLSLGDAIVAYSESACDGLDPFHWNSEAFRRAQVELLERKVDAGRSSGDQTSADAAPIELREIRRMIEDLTSRAEASPNLPATETPAGLRAISSLLKLHYPPDDAPVGADDVLSWTADAHCAKRDLAYRIEATTDSGRQLNFQEQVGGGTRNDIRIGKVTARIRNLMRKGETVQSFRWYVINMQPPPKKENCISELRSAKLREAIRK